MSSLVGKKWKALLSWRRKRKWFKGRTDMSIALCIVDVQESFRAAGNVVQSVVHQVKLARRRKAPIIILEYDGHEASYEKIYDALKGYDKWTVVQKYEDDGSMEVMQAMDRNPELRSDSIRICGVNACYCVKETAVGLHESGLFKKIELADAAISCTHDFDDDCIRVLRSSLT